MNLNGNIIKSELEQQQIRESLLACLQNEERKITIAMEKFYAQQTNNLEGCLKALEEMIAAFDRVILSGDWESSLFLRNTIKPLKNMRDQAIELRGQLKGNGQNATITAPTLNAGMLPVYIGIFQNNAHSLIEWEQQLRSLPQYILGRPVYRQEFEVQQAIRAKLMQTSDAYVCVGVQESAIQTGEFHPLRTDRQGNPLLQLLPGSVRSENILEFVYQNKRFYFSNSKLIEKPSK